MTAIALLSELFDPMIFDRILENHASSRTVLTDDHAFRPVPVVAGRSITIHDLYFCVIIYGTDHDLVTGTAVTFLYASCVALETAIETSLPLPTPRPICPALSHTNTVALNLILLQPVVTFVTFLTSKRDSSNHCNFSLAIEKQNKSIKLNT